jgi:PAS domain S-box-containing protein
MKNFDIAARGSFRRQIILIFVVGFFILISAFVVYQVKNERDYLYRDSTDDATSLAKSLAASSVSWVLASDLAGLQEVVHSFADHPGLRYAMIISPSGRILAHSDTGKVGLFLSDGQSAALLKNTTNTRVMTDRVDLVDVAAPILVGDRLVGWARVAQGRDRITDNLYRMIWRSAFFVLFSVLMSFVFAILIVNRLGERIGSLVNLAKEVGDGNYNVRASIQGNQDEITRLAEGMNRMLDTLARDEQKLRAAALYTRSLIEASLDPLLTISLDGKITDVNKATEQVTGECREKLIGTDFSEYFTDKEKAGDGYQQVLLKGYVTDYELALRHREGFVTDVLYNASVYRNEAGEVAGVFAAARDVTKSKKSEMALRELNNDFVTLLENASDFIYLKDKDGRFRFCSQTLANITQHGSWRDMIGKHDREVFPEDIAQIYEDEELPIFRDGLPMLNKIDPYHDAQGRPGWVSSNKWPVFAEDSKTVQGIFGISRDITELKLAEDKINELNRDLELRVEERTLALEAANKELEAFSYSVSHDLRTPLRAIDGFSHILLEDYADKLDAEGCRLLNVVRDNTSRMGQLIDDILKFSRTGRLELNFSWIDMEKLAHTVSEEMQPENNQLQLEIETMPRAWGDGTMMRQVWVNLLSNAIKFSHARDHPVVRVGGSVEGGELVYFVRDNGAGFDMQYVDKLFGVFQRLHSVTEFEGTGIGLAIVKRIITRNGGRVWAEGRVGEGATIYFALPDKETEHE